MNDQESESDYQKLPDQPPESPKDSPGRDDEQSILIQPNIFHSKSDINFPSPPMVKSLAAVPLSHSSDRMSATHPRVTHQDSDDNTSRRNSLSGLQFGKHKFKAEVKMNLTSWDNFVIVMYHLLEPALLGFSVGLSMQLPQLSTLIYTILTFCGMVPLLLAEAKSRIKTKITLLAIQITIAVISITLKAVAFTKLNPNSELASKKDLLEFLGIYLNNGAQTFVSDPLQILIAALLIVVYVNQLHQSELKIELGNKLRYQTEVKFHHPSFGQKIDFLYYVTWVFILADVIDFQSVVQLLVMVLLLVQLYCWALGKEWSKLLREFSLRIIQGLLFSQGLVSFICQMPAITDSAQLNHVRMFQFFGITGIQNNQGIETYARIHLVTLALAVLMVQTYFSANAINKVEMEKQAQIAEEKRQQEAEKSGRIQSFPFKSAVEIRSPANRIITPRFERQNIIRVATQFEDDDEEDFQRERSFKETLIQCWKLSKVSLLIWLCRTLSFMIAYLYHDWQALVFLLWLMYSTLYWSQQRFLAITGFVFLPLIVGVFLNYYVLNIYGLYDWTDNQYKEIQQLKFGFFQFPYPPLDFSLLTLTIFSFAWLTHIQHAELQEALNKPFDYVGFRKRIGLRQTQTLWQALYILIVLVEYPLLLCLVLAGIDKMDLYHILMLVFFVAYMMFPRSLNKFAIYLLLYADFFVVEKYIFSLCTKEANASVWLEILGFSTEYDPFTTNLYFRYPPKADQWILVILTFCAYRRQSFMETNLEAQSELEEKVYSSIFEKYPQFHRFCVWVGICFNHSIVLLSFTLFLVILSIMERTLITCVAHTVVLILLVIYMNAGSRTLIGYWNMLIIYFAFMLLSQVIYQFLVNSAVTELPNAQTIWDSLPIVFRNYLNFIGFSKYEGMLWWFFLPYILMFALAVLLKTLFRKKLEIQTKQLVFSQQEVNAARVKYNPTKVRSIQTKSSILLEMPESNENATETVQMRITTEEVRWQSEQVQHDNHIIELDNQDVERRLRSKAQYRTMVYKMAYLIYKMRVMWPALDFVSKYFFIAVQVCVICFALYWQIAWIWAVFLTLVAIHSAKNYRTHLSYRNRKETKFRMQHEGFRMSTSERDTYVGKEFRFSSKQMTPLLKRQRSTLSRNSQGRKPDAKKDQSQPFFDEKGAQLLCNKARICLTDEEAILEWNEFQAEIHGVSLKTRVSLWQTNFIVLCVAISLLYMSQFVLLTVQDPDTGVVSPALSYEVQKKIVFSLFWAGVFNQENAKYFQDVWPFYFLLFVLIIEKFCQEWLTDMFGVSDDLCCMFRKLEDDQFDLEKATREGKDKRVSKMQRQLTSSQNLIRKDQIAEDSCEDSEGSSLRTDSLLGSEEGSERPAKVAKITNRSNLTVVKETPDEYMSVHEDSRYSMRESSKQEEDPILTFENPVSSAPHLESRLKTINDSVSSYPDELSHQSQNLADQQEKLSPKSMEQPEEMPSPRCQSEVDFEKRQQQLLKSMGPRMMIKSKYQMLCALKSVMEEVFVLLVWFSCIYKENVFSLILFTVIVLMTIHKSELTTSSVRVVVFFLFVVDYVISVLNLSSYSTQSQFPALMFENTDQTTGEQTLYSVYPNEFNYFFYVPNYFFRNRAQDATTGAWSSSANMQSWLFAGVSGGSRHLNGSWIDFVALLFVSLYLNVCNLWVLSKPYKIVPSEKTTRELQEFEELITSKSKDGSETNTKALVRDYLESKFKELKISKKSSEWVFTNFALVMIAFTLAISIFNMSLLSYGYFLLCMYLIFENSVRFSSDQSRSNLYKVLCYIMLPYQLFDILLCISYQIPVPAFEANSAWAKIVGIDTVWSTTPEVLTLGQIVQPNEEITGSMTALMLKGVTFFMISLQLRILKSYSFLKFQANQKAVRQKEQDLLGLGLAYRFNNFKNVQVLKQAEDYDNIEKMLRKVRRIVARRDKLFDQEKLRKSKKNRLNSSFGAQSMAGYLTGYDKMSLLETAREHDESSVDSSTFPLDDRYAAMLEQRYNKELKTSFDKRMKKLGLCTKFYLWCRRNFVLDLYFRTSSAHLTDIVTQMESGRTGSKSKVEIRQWEATRNSWFKEKEKHRQEKAMAVARKLGLSKSLKTESAQVQGRKAVVHKSLDLDKGQKLLENNRKQTITLMKRDKDRLDSSMEVQKDAQTPINKLFENLQKQQQQEFVEREQFKRTIQHRLATQKSFKPWEQVDRKKQDCCHSCKIWSIFFFKAMLSNVAFFCYFFMIVATITNGGFLYLVFPFMIFGYALLKEVEPGRYFWYFVLCYTQLLVLANFTIQLDLWPQVLSDSTTAGMNNFFTKWNLGLKKIPNFTFWNAFLFFLPELLIISTVLAHIHSETLAGIFGVTTYEFESFEDGLYRYQTKLLERNKENSQQSDERTVQMRMMEAQHAMKVKLDFKQIRSDFHLEREYHSESEEFVRSQLKCSQQEAYPERSGEWRTLTVLDLTLEKDETRLLVDDGFSSRLANESLPFEDWHRRTRSKSVVFSREADSQKKGVYDFFVRNSFMMELFPEIKQQKPGKDMYVFIATVQIIICLYVLFFFSKMQGMKSNIATQFSQNQFSGKMVEALFAMITVMCVDRVIYSTYVFMKDSRTSISSQEKWKKEQRKWQETQRALAEEHNESD